MIDLAVILVVSNSAYQSKLTYNRPHSMLPVLGKPMVVRTMERLYHTGVQNYIVIVGEGEGAVASYLNSQWLPNVNINFKILSPSTTLLRTLTDIAQKYPTPFLITDYNCFTHTSFPETLLKRHDEDHESLLITGAAGTLSESSPQTHSQGNYPKILFEKIENIQPHLTLANLAICGDKFIEYLLEPRHHGTNSFSKNSMDIFQQYLEAGHPTHIIETSWLLQVQADYDFLRLNQQILKEGQDCHVLSELPPSVQIIAPVRIDPNVSVAQTAKIGPYVYLESGCSIGSNSKLTNIVILQNTSVPPNTILKDTIVTPYAHITNGSGEIDGQ